MAAAAAAAPPGPDPAWRGPVLPARLRFKRGIARVGRGVEGEGARGRRGQAPLRPAPPGRGRAPRAGPAPPPFWRALCPPCQRRAVNVPFQAVTQCEVSDDVVPDLREYAGVAEPEFLKSRTVLLVPGKITFNRELYLGLREENHNAEITLVFLKNEVFDPLPVVIRSCAGGLLLLAFIVLLLWKCGFFKRNYKAMMEQEDTS
ncbi:uncharacterized protein RG961_009969 [Leptosomus discolor]